MASLKKVFTVSCHVDPPVVVGQDDIAGRRQLILVTDGEVTGEYNGEAIHGTLLPYGVDSQVIRPNGVCELSARYAVKLDNGASFYIENNGIRTVPDEYVSEVLQGKFVDPDLYYFCTKPTIEVYDRRLDWMTKRVFVCSATRLPDQVLINYFTVEKE